MAGYNDRPEERFLEILAKQLVTDIGFEKAFAIAGKARDQAKLESGTKQHPAVSTRFMQTLMVLKNEPIRVLQEDQQK